MIDLRPHRAWTLAIISAIFLMIAGNFAATLYKDALVVKTNSHVLEKQDLDATLQQMRDDMATVKQIGKTMDEEKIASILAPTDKMATATMLEKLASTAGLARFSYSISPEKPATGISSAANLYISAITIEAEAPDDRAAYKFISSAQKLMGGQARLHKMDIARISEQSTMGATNVKMTANIDWLHNGSVGANGK
ncbi:MAG: hypothetical protein PHX43_01955 [Alphaproteobacteria bacterium]|nr:hypothetical protein [Alphaproteobacteria bacterium]